MQKLTNKDKVMAAVQTAGAKDTERKDMKYWVVKYQPEIAKALPSVITPERFERMALTAIAKNSKLAEATPGSFIGAMLQAAQLGLEPNTPLGQAYLIPFYNGKTKQQEVQFQLGYKGLIELAYRSGEIREIYAEAVYPSDTFEYHLGLARDLRHIPALDHGSEEPIYYYAVWKLVNGGFGFAVMSMAEVKSHVQRYSEAAKKGYSPWQDNFDSMAKKTVIKQALKYAPIKVEFVRQLTADETVKTEIASDMLDVEGERLILDDVDFEVVDEETGEVAQPSKDSEKNEGGTLTPDQLAEVERSLREGNDEQNED